MVARLILPFVWTFELFHVLADKLDSACLYIDGNGLTHIDYLDNAVQNNFGFCKQLCAPIVSSCSNNAVSQDIAPIRADNATRVAEEVTAVACVELSANQHRSCCCCCQELAVVRQIPNQMARC